MDISLLTPKQLKKLENRLNNEKQRAAKLQRKAMQPSSSLATGLSKGQRRRINRQRAKVDMVIPRGLPATSNPALSRMFPSGASGRGERRMNIVEDEFITNINGSVSFATSGFYMNPGQVLTFPWLSTISKQFEKYEVKSMTFYYKPLVSGFATAGQTGKIMLSFDYDASDPLPSTKQQVEDTHPHADAMPYEECYLPLSSYQLNSQDSKYVRPGGLPPNADIKTYDGGLLAVSTQGCQNTSEIGELRVRYSIDLFVPVLESTTTIPTNFHTSIFEVTPGAITSGDLLWTATAVNPLGILAAAGTLIFPAGNYLLTMNLLYTDSSGGQIQVVNNNTSENLIIGSVLAGEYDTYSVTEFFMSSGSSTLSYLCNVDPGASLARAKLFIRSV